MEFFKYVFTRFPSRAPFNPFGTKIYYRTERQDVITEPKIKQSVRVVEIPEFLKQEIKDFVDRHYGMPDNTI